jgi:hypothetical protein
VIRGFQSRTRPRRNLAGGGAYLLPNAYREPGFWRDELMRLLGATEFTPVPVPYDCVDGFYGAYWRRPEAFLDPAVRAGISVFANCPPQK